MRSIYKVELAQKKPADMQALADRLLKDGVETKDKPATSFTLLLRRGGAMWRRGPVTCCSPCAPPRR